MGFSSKFKVLLIVPAVALGVVVFVFMIKSRQGPKHAEDAERVTAVRVIPAPEVSIVPRAVGYGKVQPGQTWEAVAEVSGKIIEIHPNLKRGVFLPKDTVLLRIDPASYDLAHSRSKSDVKSLQAQLNELEQREKNFRRLLETEKHSQTLSSKELERKRKLSERGIISISELDQEEKRVLAQQNAVENLQSSLNLIPAQKKALLAKISSSKSQLEGTGLEIEKTTIRVPFDCRIAKVNVELAQAAKAGQVLVVADAIDTSEISAQVPLYALKNLISPGATPLFTRKSSMKEIMDDLGLRAVVRLSLHDKSIEWKASVSRMAETINPETQTLGVYVVVDDPYLKARPGERPPLIKNMYCEVELRGKPRPKSVVIPRAALHQGIVYVVNAQNRLERRAVTMDYSQGSLTSIKKGLKPGEKVIVTDIVPAIEGMLLTQEIDKDLLESIVSEATGEAPLR